MAGTEGVTMDVSVAVSLIVAVAVSVSLIVAGAVSVPVTVAVLVSVAVALLSFFNQPDTHFFFYYPRNYLYYTY